MILSIVPADSKHGLAGPAQVIAVGKSLAAEHRLQLVHLPPGHPARIYGLPVNSRHSGHVFRALHPALQLHRRYAHLLQFPEIRGQTIVL